RVCSGRTMFSCRARPIRKQANNSVARSAIFDSVVHGSNQITTPVTSRPGAASSRVKRMTRRSKRVRRVFFRRRCAFSFTPGREPIFFHPPVQCATAEAQRLRNLADIALEALERFANQNTFHGFQTQFFEVLRGRALTPEAQI